MNLRSRIARACYRTCERFPRTWMPLWILRRAALWLRHGVRGEP